LPIHKVIAANCAAVTGLWFDPALDGEGFNLLEADGGLIITYYGYVDNGNRLWLISDLITAPIRFTKEISVNMLVGSGGSFQQPLPPGNLNLWGSLKLNFSDSGHAEFTLAGVDGGKTAQVIKLAGAIGQDCKLELCIIPTSTPLQLSFPNDAVHGIFDPSLGSNPSSNNLWLSYSTVSISAQWPLQNTSVIQNRLARSSDGGESFTFVNEINPVRDVSVGLDPPENAGTWVNEVSSLAYDAGADPEQRWKLIWHHYLQINGQRHFEHGWLGYRAAAQPDQLQNATEFKLFGANLYDPVNNNPDGATHSPVAGSPLIDVAELSPQLSQCATLSEPGWLANDDALYLAVGCFELNPSENRMVLLACTQPCTVTSPQAWRFVATLLINANAQALGFKRFSAPDLFRADGGTYLWVSPVTDSPFPGSYNGCRAFRFQDISTGTLQTDRNGLPIPALALDGLPNTFNGACAFHEAFGNRAFYSQLMLSAPDQFQIFRVPAGSCFAVRN